MVTRHNHGTDSIKDQEIAELHLQLTMEKQKSRELEARHAARDKFEQELYWQRDQLMLVHIETLRELKRFQLEERAALNRRVSDSFPILRCLSHMLG